MIGDPRSASAEFPFAHPRWPGGSHRLWLHLSTEPALSLDQLVNAALLDHSSDMQVLRSSEYTMLQPLKRAAARMAMPQ